MTSKVPLRTVTVRDLGRHTAAILDELNSEGRPMIVIRGGVPVACLQPLDANPWKPIVRENPLEVEEDPVDLEELDLNDLQRRIITHIEGSMVPDQILVETNGEVKETILALSQLELTGLLTTGWTGYELTIKGKRVRDALEDEGRN